MPSKSTRGFTLIEMLIVVTVIGVISAIAVPNLLQSRMAGNEASAISSVRNIVSAEMSYSVSTGAGRYGSITALMNNSLVDSVVGSGTKDGYTVVFTPGAGNDSFTVDARPVTFRSTGVRSFYADQSGVIRYTTVDASATSASAPPVKSIQELTPVTNLLLSWSGF